MNNNSHNCSPSDWDDFKAGNAENMMSARDAFTRFKKFKEIFDLLPKSELLDRGWIKSKNDISSLVSFYNDFNDTSSFSLFRKSENANDTLISLWISKIKEAAIAEVISSDTPKFIEIDRSFIKNLAQSSVSEDNIKDIKQHLAARGIILIYLKSLPGMKLDGVVFNLCSGNPVIGMSLRFPRLDYFWFTLIHELAHIVLHKKLLDTPILDDIDAKENSSIEIEANRLTHSTFVDRALWRNCEPKYNKSEESIKRFARTVNIHPTIIAGMIRRESGDYASYSKLVNSINVREILGYD